jgi:RND family efflux transporter MFP subunit
MKPRRILIAAVVAVVLVAGASLLALRKGGDESAAPATPAAAAGGARPALSVALTRPQTVEWPQTLAANGTITAWQEAIIGAELAGLRVVELNAHVGDRVQRGQVLARLAPEAVNADLAQAQAALAEAEAALAEAQSNAERTRKLQAQGFISPQATNTALTAEQANRARVAAARARLQAEQLRLTQTRVVAPDEGVISGRNATVGSLSQPGQEMFRLIRGGRLEWRAELTAAELARIKPGMKASLVSPAGERLEGRVRTVAPTVDAATRTGIAYVDLPAGSAARAGSFARGSFELDRSEAMVVPQGAVLLRDGFAYVFLVGADNRVLQSKIELGRRLGEHVEIVNGLDRDARVVASGAGFLADGDLVRVVEPSAAAAR